MSEQIEVTQDEKDRDRLVEEVAVAILEIPRETTLSYYVRIGELLFREIYGSSLEEMRAKGGKRISLRMLSERLSRNDQAGFSAVTLCRMIQMFDIDRRLNVSDWKALTPQRVRAVNSLSDDEQVRLLSRADAEGWTQKRLVAEVAKLRRAAPEPRIGCPPLPRFLKAARAIGRAHAESKPDLFEDLDALDRLPRSEVDELLATLRHIQDDCLMLHIRIARQRRGRAT